MGLFSLRTAISWPLLATPWRRSKVSITACSWNWLIETARSTAPSGMFCVAGPIDPPSSSASPKVAGKSGSRRATTPFETGHSLDLGGQISALHRSQAVISFTPEGTILDANANFLQAMGYALDEVQGRHHSLFVDEAERASDGYRRFWAALAG
jgi:PAS domain-containing protein